MAHVDNLGWLHLEILNYICKDLFFQIKSQSEAPRIKTWMYLFEGHHSTHYTLHYPSQPIHQQVLKNLPPNLLTQPSPSIFTALKMRCFIASLLHCYDPNSRYLCLSWEFLPWPPSSTGPPVSTLVSSPLHSSFPIEQPRMAFTVFTSDYITNL